ncbi:MAG: RNA polymerase sigma-70 factor [Mucilaginibacter sp.]
MGAFSDFLDKQLVDLIKQDNLEAFNEIYKRHWKKLYAAAFKRLKNKELAEEVVQEIFARLWFRRHSLVITTELGGYLHSSAAHIVIDYYRKELIKEKYQHSLQHNYGYDNSTEEEIVLKDLQHTIDEEVKHLPVKCRLVYELSRVEHKTNKEIAYSLGISEKTVENHLTKALKRLRLGLTEYYLLILVLLLK